MCVIRHYNNRYQNGIIKLNGIHFLKLVQNKTYIRNETSEITSKGKKKEKETKTKSPYFEEG